MQLHVVSSLDYLSCIAIEVAQIEFCQVIYMLKKNNTFTCNSKLDNCLVHVRS